MRWKVLVAAVTAVSGFISVIVAALDVTGYALVVWRCAFAAAALPLIAALLGRLGSVALRRHRLRVVGLGALLALHWALFFETLQRSSVAVAILLVYTAPIFLAVLAPAFLPERRSRAGLAALAVSAPGLVLIALSGDAGHAVEPGAVGTGLGGALTYAILVIVEKDTVVRVSPFALAFWMYVVAAASLAPMLAAADRPLPHGADWGYLVLLGAALTAALGVLWMRALRQVTAQAAGLLGYVEPVSASLLAWAILGQPIGWQVAAGGALVAAGGAIVVLYEGAEPPPLEAPSVAAEPVEAG